MKINIILVFLVERRDCYYMNNFKIIIVFIYVLDMYKCIFIWLYYMIVGVVVSM